MSNYQGSAPANHNIAQHYANSGGLNRHTSVYQSQVRGVEDNHQQQYGSNAYGWAHQNQNTASAATQNAYTNEQWQNRQAAYSYPREYYGPSESGNLNSQQYQSRDTYNSQNTQGLNHLAYASGLEPAAPVSDGVRSSQPQNATPYQPSPAPSVSQARTASPANANIRYGTNVTQQPTQAPYTNPHSKYSPSMNNPNLAVEAAAALASAARNRQSRPSHQTANMANMRSSNSPAMLPIQTASQLTQRNSASYNLTPTVIEHRRKASDQTHQSSITPVNNLSNAPPASNIVRDHVVEPIPAPKASKRTNTTQQPPPSETPRQQVANLNPQSIANLVSSPERSERQPQDDAENQELMPHYVDPTQVFNPFHKEYERKKREAAEAEARKKAEEQRRAEHQHPNQSRGPTAESAKKTSEDAVAPNSKSKVTKKARATDLNKSNQRAAENTASTGSSAPDEDSMATELQKMMAKMKEFRSSNPALFQKLWNDMRGGGPSVAPTTVPVPQSPSPQMAQKDLPAEAEKPTKTSKPRKRKPDNPSAPANVPLNGYKVVVEDNPEDLPDLGRFPAERRVRQSYAKPRADAMGETQMSTEQAVSKDNMSQVMPTPTPARPAEAGVAWPEPRRRAVAIAAFNLLKSNPLNESVQINANEICSLLERNPSYLDLCTALETRGLRFQRTTFARELLKSVPELQTPVTKASAPTRQDITSISTVAHAQLPISPATSSQPLVNTQHMLQKPLFPPSSNQSYPSSTPQASASLGINVVKSEGAKPAVKPPTKTSKSQASRPSEPLMGSKEAAARKRDFSELIDLTELDDNENYVLPPTKQARIEQEPQIDPFKNLATSTRPVFSGNSSAPLRFNPVSQSQGTALTPHLQAYSQASRPSPLMAEPPKSHSGKQRMVLARTVDHSEALSKSYYDPKTVARDILIACGRHPSERPLNLHLANLVGNYLDMDSDVSTFDWDAIDPGGPPLPRVEYVDVPAAPPRFRLGERVRKRARMTDIEGTRHPQEAKRGLPTLQTPTLSQRQSRTASPHSVSSSRQDQNLSSKLAHRLYQNNVQKFRPNETEGVETPSNRKISIDIPTLSSSRTPVSPKSNESTVNKPKMNSDEFTKPRRGRPPGSKNKNTPFAAMKQQAKALVHEVPQAQALEEQVPEPTQHNYKCKWVKCHAELHNLDVLKRHISKKHVLNEAESEKGQLVCWWKRCLYLEPDGSGNMAPKKIFTSRKELEKHVFEDHVQPIALKHGDGPKTTNTGKQTSTELNLSKFLYKPQVGPFTRTFSHTDPQSVEASRQRFLSDSNGRSTTPLVSPDGNSEHPPDPMVLTKAYPNGPKTDKEKADVAAQNAFMKAHGNKHKDGRRAAEEVMRAMEARKRKVGPGIDRGGCTLINEARRSTFDQAPGISGIVPLEY